MITLYKGIIFDLDGVITATSTYHFLAWKSMCNSYNLTFDKKINEKLKGISRADSLDVILKENNKLTDFNESQKNLMAKEKNDFYIEYVNKLTKKDILPGINELIEHANKNRIKLAVASVSKNAKTVLNKLELTYAFDYIADPTKISKPKPDPEIFAVCADNLKIHYDQCIGIEDSQSGIISINSCGMFSVGINVDVVTESPKINLNSTSELYKIYDMIDNKIS